MKKLILIFLSTVTLFACDKVYINGDLDGMWHLQSVSCEDSTIIPEAVYYSFQRHMTQISKHYDTELPLRFLGNMRHANGTLTMWGFHIHPLETHAATPEELALFHLCSDSTTFRVITLNEKRLVLEERGRIFTLRKW